MRLRSLVPLVLASACATPPAEKGPIAPVSRFATFGGKRVHYLDAGRGRGALVLVHGWASDTTAWRHQFPALAERMRVIVVDLPGHGKSEAPAEDYSMALFADAVAAVLADAGIERAVLVGHSNGAPVVTNVYRRHRERTLALVVVDGALRRMMDPEAVEPMLAPFRGYGWRDAMAAMIDGMPAPGLSDDDRAAIKAMALATRHEAVTGGMDAALDPHAWSAEPIDVPVLALHAPQPTWTEEYEAFVRDLAPLVDYQLMEPGTGHYLMVERPREFRRRLEAFLDAHGL